MGIVKLIETINGDRKLYLVFEFLDYDLKKYLDYKLHIDDPVGAVAVHMMNGIWGTFAVGLFATKAAPLSECVGLFYGGGFHLLGLQLTGIASVAIWTIITITITFLVIRKIFGLRVSELEEVIGLDIEEHGSECYPYFMQK